MVQCAGVFIQKNWNTSLASWPTGSGSCCVGKSNFVVTCALANKLARIALGTDGATANLRSIKAEIHQFKQSFIWFCEY
uniref:Mobile element protein n=1 Tax=Klebsiella pneumoniae TaxID=573 RepID=A0A8B0ST18_KLEPN|nr:Mobile element protein [Klebsiella pneumoniae]